MRVDQNAPGGATPDGQTWPTAYPELRDALAANITTSGPVEYWIAEGTYLPTATTDDSISFEVRSVDSLIGGFIGFDPSGTPGVGNELDAADRQGSFDATILSGDIDPMNPNTAARTDHVVRIVSASLNSSDPRTLLDGFRVEFGFADDLTTSITASGGGILAAGVNHVELANLTVTNCGASGDGGGVAIWTVPTLRVRRCEFTNNRCGRRVFQNGQQVFVGSGGGMFLNFFSGLAFQGTGNAAIANSIFTGNLAPNGGALHAERQRLGQFSMLNCLVNGNTGVVSCGGIQFVGPSGSPTNSNVTYSHLTVTENLGGGVEFSSPLGSDSTQAAVMSSIIWNNSAPGVDQELFGSYFTVAASTPLVRFSDIGSATGPAVPWTAPPYGGNGNISVDPEFVAPGSGNFRLSLTAPSPCIDAGSDVGLPPASMPFPQVGEVGDAADLNDDQDPFQLVLVDLDDLVRERDVALVADTGEDDPASATLDVISDMGCYEQSLEVVPPGSQGGN